MRACTNVVAISSVLLGLTVVLMSATTLVQAQHESRQHGGRRKQHDGVAKHARTSTLSNQMHELHKSTHRVKSQNHEIEKEQEDGSRQLGRTSRGGRGGSTGRGGRGGNTKRGGHGKMNNNKARGSTGHGGPHSTRGSTGHGGFDRVHKTYPPPPPPPPPPPKISTSFGGNYASEKRLGNHNNRPLISNWGSSIGLKINEKHLPIEPNPNPGPPQPPPPPPPITGKPVTQPPTRPPTRPPTNAPPVPTTPTTILQPTDSPTRAPVTPSPTPSETLAPTILEHFIPECEDGCTFDEECVYGTSCLYADSSSISLPGCGNAIGAPGSTHCITPPSKVVVVVADSTRAYQDYATENNLPSNPFPLDECQGDCDSDADCKGTLRCLERFNDEGQLEDTLEFTPIPGCTFYNVGQGAIGKDYCFDATEYLFFVGNDLPDQPGPTDLKVCEGDCDSDDDCSGSLRCFERSAGVQTVVPGCENGSPYADFESGVNILDTIDFCYDATGYLSYVSANGENAAETIVPFARKDSGLIGTGLGECQGDCDSNADCRGNFVCFETENSVDQNGRVNVPGCLDPYMAESMEGFDFCCNPNDPQTGAACRAGSTG